MDQREDYADPDLPRHWFSILLDLTVLWLAVAAVGVLALLAHFIRT